MANEFIIKNGLISQGQATISGSLTVTSGITGSFSGTITSASYSTTASYAQNGITPGDVYRIPIYNTTTGFTSSLFFQSGSYTTLRGGNTPEDPSNPDILYISGDGVDTYNLLSAHGNLNSYVQLNVQNYNTGVSSSSDIVATADNGTEDTNYINMGINSENHALINGIGAENDAYMYSTGNNLFIGNRTANKKVIIFNGADGSALENARVYIDDNGSVGINSSAITPGDPEALLVESLSATTINLITARANVDNYVQFKLLNQNSGPMASADIVAQNDLGSETDYYVDMGMNSSGHVPDYNYTVGGPNDTYLLSVGRNHYMGSPKTGSLIFFTGDNFNGDLHAKLSLHANNFHSMTGSLSITGGVTASLQGTASYASTASYVQNAQTASYVTLAQTASYVTNAQTASYVTNAQTASYVQNAVSASQGVTSSYSLTLGATLGQNAAGTFQLKNSAGTVISSLNVNTITASLAYTASYVVQSISSSYASTASYVQNAQTASYITTAQTASYVQNAVSSSYSTTSSYALTAQTLLGSVVSSSYAATASIATSSSYATVAQSVLGSITSASYATTASYSVTSSYATTAQTLLGSVVSSSYAATASYSTTASYATVAQTLLGSVVSSSYAATASYVSNAQTASYVVTAQTASYVLNAVNASTASYVQNAQTASYVTTAQTASYVLNAVSASYSNTASYVINAQTASYVQNAVSASYTTTAQTASYFGGTVVSSSYATTSSYALTAQTLLGSVTSASYAVSASYAPYTVGTLATAQARRSTGYTLTATSTPVTFNNTDVENQVYIVYHDDTNTDRIYVASDGLYMIHYHCDIAQGTTVNDFELVVVKNGTTILSGSLIAGKNSSTDKMPAGITSQEILTSGSYVTLNAKYVASSGGIVNNAVLSVTKMEGVAGPQGPSGSAGAPGGVTSIIAGTNITISPTNGLGDVTINAAGGGGTPGGATGDIQYNNAGAFGGASNVEINNGNLQLVSTTDPTAPFAGNLIIYSKDIAGRQMPKWIGPSGVDTPIQPNIMFNQVSVIGPGGGTTVGVLGCTVTSVGTISNPNITTTNLKTQTRRIVNTSAATAGSLASTRVASLECWRGNTAGQGGFFSVARFGFTTLQTGQRMFIGLDSNATAAPTNIDYLTSTTTAKIGMYATGSTGNWVLIHNTAASIPTQITLGANYPIDNTTLLEMILYAKPNDTAVTYRITNLSTGAQTSGTLSSNLPANNQPLGRLIAGCNNATAAAMAWDLSRFSLETDY